MNSSQTIFDISSDEEPALEDPKFGDDDYNWLWKLLEDVDKSAATAAAGDGGDDEDDDVMVVGEWNPPKPKSKSRSKSKSLKPVEYVDSGDDGDDDCVVLDADPENPVAVTDNCSSSDGEDVLCVGQKGEIACRDLPHSRHLCAKFPFSSTPHERHCDFCYCYVCDSPAPCAHWALGVFNTDHCHATDKIVTWKSLRESFRNLKPRKVASLNASKFSDTPHSVSVAQCNQVAPHGIIRLASNSMTQNCVSSQPTIRPCTSTTRSASLNVISQDRNWMPGCARSRRRFMSRSVSHQGLGVRNNVIGCGRGPNISNFGQRYASPNTMFKMPVTIGHTFQTNHSVYGSSNNLNCAPASQFTRNSATLPPLNHKNQVFDSSYEYLDMNAHQSYSQPNVSSAIANGAPSLHEVYIQSIPQSNGSLNLCHPGDTSHNVVDSGFHDLGTGSINSTSRMHIAANDIGFHETGCNNRPSIVSQINSEFNGNAQLHHKDWLTNQSVSVASDGRVPSILGVFSPETAAIDAGIFSFHYEPSWDGPSHA